jgi:DNA helicase HerA-like ATPase
MQDYEKLGVFYLGRRYDPDKAAALDEALLYDARDLVTHGVIVGMTGSGKTGLAISLLEELAIDGIPRWPSIRRATSATSRCSSPD